MARLATPRRREPMQTDTRAGDAPSYELEVREGPAVGARLPLTLPATLGRRPPADVELGDPAAAPRHACLEIVAGAPVVRDLDSPAGTTVNGEPLLGPRSLRDGDEIRIG